ncbi:hypothetical protein TIFTF001_035232 [Ficus carica]|uniref:Bet v I/Major latex protein domain-containing protein n=1 Tax=Ficus carica TaxID=3494 RepID=A0AA88E9Z6_FICCA|nr:hypothetical protein TIFTF001_035232 [Ficus carica]
MSEMFRAKVGVGIERLWKALAKDLRFVIPKAIPSLVKQVEVVEGDGGLGTVFLFSFGSDVTTMTYQKEKIVELDESLHQMGLQVIEGGHLDLGFSSYTTTFQLTTADYEEQKTLINFKVSYESEIEESAMPSKTTASILAFISRLESYLLNGSF